MEWSYHVKNKVVVKNRRCFLSHPCAHESVGCVCQSALFGAMFPFSANDLSLRAFSDAWLIFVLEMGVLGVIMLYAAREPARNRILVLTVSILELIRGAGGDLLWISRGWHAANYIPFMILHLIISGTGLCFLRQESANKSTN